MAQEQQQFKQDLGTKAERKSKYHWDCRPLDFHPLGVQQPDAQAIDLDVRSL
jgi:hypothetical protein